MLSGDVFLGVVDAAPLVAMDLVIVRGGTQVLLGLDLATLSTPPRLETLLLLNSELLAHTGRAQEA